MFQDDDTALIRKWLPVQLTGDYVKDLRQLCKIECAKLRYKRNLEVYNQQDSAVKSVCVAVFDTIIAYLDDIEDVTFAQLQKDCILINRVKQVVNLVSTIAEAVTALESAVPTKEVAADAFLNGTARFVCQNMLAEMYMAVAATQNSEVNEYIAYAQRYKGQEVEIGSHNTLLVGNMYVQSQHILDKLQVRRPNSKLIATYKLIAEALFDKLRGCLNDDSQLKEAVQQSAKFMGIPYRMGRQM